MENLQVTCSDNLNGPMKSDPHTSGVDPGPGKGRGTNRQVVGG